MNLREGVLGRRAIYAHGDGAAPPVSSVSTWAKLARSWTLQTASLIDTITSTGSMMTTLSMGRGANAAFVKMGWNSARPAPVPRANTRRLPSWHPATTLSSTQARTHTHNVNTRDAPAHSVVGTVRQQASDVMR